MINKTCVCVCVRTKKMKEINANKTKRLRTHADVGDVRSFGVGVQNREAIALAK